MDLGTAAANSHGTRLSFVGLCVDHEDCESYSQDPAQEDVERLMMRKLSKRHGRYSCQNITVDIAITLNIPPDGVLRDRYLVTSTVPSAAPKTISLVISERGKSKLCTRSKG